MGLLRASETDEIVRDLQLNPTARCNRRLAACRASIGSDPLPVKEWKETLDELGESNPYAFELASAVGMMEELDFSAIVAEVGSLPLKERLTSGVRLWTNAIVQLSKIDLSKESAPEASDSLLEVVENTEKDVSPRQMLGLTIVYYILEVIIILVSSLSDGITGIFVGLIEVILLFFDTFARTMRTVTLLPFTDSDCMAELMECDFNTMMAQVVPAMIEAI